MTVATGFSASKPISCAQGRYGEIIIAQGGGVRPKRWTGSGSATFAGISAPVAAPTITASTTKKFYVARIDVQKAGTGYGTPPGVTFTSATAPTRPAKAAAYLSQASVSEVVVTDGGKGYSEPPVVTLTGGSVGSGATFTAVLDTSSGVPPGVPGGGTVPPMDTGILFYEITQEPPYGQDVLPGYSQVQYGAWGPIEMPLDANGTFTVNQTVTFYHGGYSEDPADCENYIDADIALSYTVSGIAAGASGAKALIRFAGEGVDFAACEDDETGESSTCVVRYHTSTFIESVDVKEPGTGYTDDVTITIHAWPPDYEVCVESPDSPDIVIVGHVLEGLDGLPNSLVGPTTINQVPGYPVKSVTIDSGGTGYSVTPELQFSSATGFGAYATCTVTNGVVTAVNLISGGDGYTSAPSVTIAAGGGEVFPVMRPHLRGKYQCYYRYVDTTAESSGGPIPSNLSPLYELDTPDGTGSIGWSITHSTEGGGRDLNVELWRSTGDQSLMLYRVATLVGGATTYTDSLTDEELRDPDRQGYAAMPIVLPNGDVNALRFGVPPSTKSAVVKFQDRFWYGVDTGGSQPNTIYFSEIDEPESVPDVNEFVLQQNRRDADAITALVPFGESLLIMQDRSAHALTYARQPLRDATVLPLAQRGCLNQRCWDVFEGICYAMDRFGVYSITTSGDVDNISLTIANIFASQVDFSNTTWNFVSVDSAQRVVRAFVSLRGPTASTYPTRALCYSIDTKAWWMETYPHRLTAGVNVQFANGDFRCVYAGHGGAFVLGEGGTDYARGAIVRVQINERGAGYRTPPTVTASGGVGAEFQASIDGSGRLTGVRVLSTGYGYTSGSLVISAPDDPDHPSPVQATATFDATAVGSDTATWPLYRFKGGNYEFPTDMTSEAGGAGTPRDVSLTYMPQRASCPVALRLYYNNSTHPRPNVAARNRGVGFVGGTADAASVLDMGALTVKTGSDSGVAKGVFYGRTIDDVQSADRHVAAELIGAAKGPDPVVFYALDVYGVSTEGDK